MYSILIMLLYAKRCVCVSVNLDDICGRPTRAWVAYKRYKQQGRGACERASLIDFPFVREWVRILFLIDVFDRWIYECLIFWWCDGRSSVVMFLY